MDVLVTAKTRYATKAYNAEKKIPQQQFEKLLEVQRWFHMFEQLKAYL